MSRERYLQCIYLLSYPDLSINCPDYVGVIDRCMEVTSHLLTIFGGIMNGLQ